MFGEVGLGGEVRPVVGSALRVAEATKLGFSRVIGPPVNRQARGIAVGDQLISVTRLAAVIESISADLLREATRFDREFILC